MTRRDSKRNSRSVYDTCHYGCTVSAPPSINEHANGVRSIRRYGYGGVEYARVLERCCARRDVTRGVLADGGRPGDLVLQKSCLHPTDGSGEAENGKVDERRMATTSTIWYA